MKKIYIVLWTSDDGSRAMAAFEQHSKARIQKRKYPGATIYMRSLADDLV